MHTLQRELQILSSEVLKLHRRARTVKIVAHLEAPQSPDDLVIVSIPLVGETNPETMSSSKALRHNANRHKLNRIGDTGSMSPNGARLWGRFTVLCFLCALGLNFSRSGIDPAVIGALGHYFRTQEKREQKKGVITREW